MQKTVQNLEILSITDETATPALFAPELPEERPEMTGVVVTNHQKQYKNMFYKQYIRRHIECE